MKRRDPLELTEADGLVAGDDRDPQPYGLGLLLAAARAPAWAEELAGEDEAVERLVAARRAALSDSPVRSHDARVPLPRKTFAVRLAAAMVSLVVVGGIAAAECGSLPAPVQQRAHDLFSLLGIPVPEPDSRQGSEPSGDRSGTSTSPGPAPTLESSASASGALDPSGVEARALCRAWAAAGRDPNGAAMDGQSWRTLVAVAGDRTRVAAMCGPLLGTSTDTGPAGSPAANAPASRPGGGPANPSRSAGGGPADPNRPAGGGPANPNRPADANPANPNRPAGGGPANPNRTTGGGQRNG